MSALPAYAELRCVSNHTYLRGASQPEELVERASQLGYSALAIADECSLAGIVRAHVAAKEHGLKLLVGTQVQVACGHPFTLLVLACNLNGYGNLCEFITKLRRGSEKGKYELQFADLTAAALEDCVVVACPKRMSTPEQLETTGRWLLSEFRGRCWFGVDLLRLIDDEMWLYRLRQVSELTAIPLVAAGDVHFHVRSRKPLQDVLTATRVGRPLTECGLDLQPNAERHLRTRLRLAQTYPEDLLAETLNVAARCQFSLEELRYQYPDEVVPDGETPSSYLRRLTYEGAGRRWPEGVPAKVQLQIEHELTLIQELRYEHYFLTVADIVQFARSRNILCQGRGSAANSVVCYCVGVTEVDPARMSVLFERFISKERNEPPDIDIDFEHERREEVLQYLYRRYGRDRAAITGVVTSYRPKSAVRDVGKALGFDLEVVDQLAKNHQWFDGKAVMPERLVELGLSLDDLKVRQLMLLTGQLLGFPRHLSQHTGGFVLTRTALSRLIPIENASMKDRTVLEWDKDDLDALGFLKVDCLALGMLTAIRKCLDFIGQRKGFVFAMQDIPAEDPETYEMISRADTVGVFQIESRAQMSMLPRLKPRCFYDLVVEVALVRPGPIVGGMVHPYLRRRQGLEPVTYPSEALKEALGRTLGVPVFQEQVMQIAMLAAGFTAGEADGLRRAMAAWKRKGGLEKYHSKIVEGMTTRGYEKAFAEQIFEQIKGFSEYGFPESHAASFALLVYASSWIKRHHPAEFLTAMLNSQPLGFYSPSQLVQDAKRHGVVVRPPDVMHSNLDCTLEDLPHAPAVRLGLRLLAGLRWESAQRIVDERARGPFDNAEDLARRARLELAEMKLLASADALMSLSGHRRVAVWDAAALRSVPELLQEARVDEDVLELAPAPEGEEVMFDYAATGLTLRSHPLALLRPLLAKRGLATAADLQDVENGAEVRYCGLVTLRQQPETANGVIFVSLEDETGVVQVIAWRSIKEAQRQELLNARLLAVKGTWQREGELRSLVAERLKDLTPLLGRLRTTSRDFH
ncbi:MULTISPECIES: error-prone DNA polymerase [unclassified Variovorax]|uniref:error-prone DNA polymerase n=1 Tax=unclassified Variovorax TaxID=663243 RepID=UPI001317B7D1|nr:MULTISPECIES: error-prone DNA polymerase [unclassified Variovorax]VTU43231.1 Error-prone DNA polymerase [Variovorax sp. PBL-H6]VTU43364.1 Error-prone DNA polymerase [Variovorax sp. SRS16]VTU43414.1 Error-prone DNA polymerase [Variovorax sp. PBL-E5]